MNRNPRGTLLIVEDDLGLARLQQRRLERAGYAVLVTASAEEAAQRAQEGDIDLMILDQHLPGSVSGLELYRRVRAANLDVPAILVTGLREDELLLQALRAGVRDFVLKTPEYLDYLLPAVERVLKQVRTERQLVESSALAREALRRQRELEAEIAQRKRAEKMLKDADRRKDEFLAMLAHELRNPLAPIRNAISILQQLMPEEKPFRQPLEVLDRQARQLADLVDDLLDVSRITRGQIKLRKQILELAEIVAQAVETSRPLLEARRHRFNLQLPEEPIFVEADPTRLAQVILNLLNNAAKYSEEGGYVCLTVEKSGDVVVLRVRDSGIGISPEALPKIFELFAQGERSLDRAQGGLGIGLTLVRRLVELHGGTVQAMSEGLGRGSEFVVRLPTLKEEGRSRTVEKESTPDSAVRLPPSAVSKRRILIVDDNRDSAESLATLLQMLGHDVGVAYDGEAALRLAAQLSPDIVLLDIGLPRLSGLEAAQRIRHDVGLRDSILIAMTGYGQEEDKRRSLEAGFNAHLVKPVDFGELQALLERCTPASAKT